MSNSSLENYKEDAQGRLVPIATIKPEDLQRDELVHELVHELAEKAKSLSHKLRIFREAAHGDIAALIQIAADKYKVDIGGKKGNVTLTSFNGRYRIQRQISEQLVFDERLQAAKVLIDECLTEWSKDSPVELKAIVNDAFQVSKEGHINTARVLTLRRLDIKDEKWQAAMQAISDALSVASTKSYIRIFERQPNGSYALINLDLPNANYVLPDGEKGGE